MNQGLIPARYAKALYKLASEQGTAERLYGLMRTLCQSFEQQPALGAVMANPFVGADDKRALVMTAAGADKATDQAFADFVTLLIRNRRIDLLRQAALAYIQLYRQAHDIFAVTVTTAAPMPEQLRQRITSLVQSHLKGATLELDQRIDPDLIGGFTIQMASERLDASVRTQLQQLRQQFNS